MRRAEAEEEEANGNGGESFPLTGRGTGTVGVSAAAVDNRVGQKLIKVIGNVCFSFFVFAVLVVTVIAITYQPPDPWLDSSKALTRSFSGSLDNSTFQPDDSLLPTAEDQQQQLLSNSSGANNHSAVADSSSPPVAAAIALPPISVPLSTTAGGSSFCNSSTSDSSSVVNCSVAAVLAAIVKFNAKVFSKSIVFLAYETPVPGSKPGECDAAWSFRNRKEKSRRRYRDYRRFHLVPTDNCTFAVTRAGRFRSGTNAARRIRASKTPPPPPSSSPLLKDADINDTIPVVGSEEFRRGRYLYYSRGGDYCKGMSQYLWSFLCGLGEAQFLNRTFVVDLDLCLAASYNPSNKDEPGKDFRNYFDFEHLKESASVVEEREFLRDWAIWERAGARGRKKKKSVLTVRKVSTYKITPMQLRKDRSTIIWRQFDGSEPDNYWYRVCEGRAAKYVQRPWQAIWKSKRLMNIATEIAGRMDWDYDAVHVVRGYKAANKELWPNLDADTSPNALVGKLLKTVKQWRNLYIATNEPFYNYFDKLRSHYKVHLLDDYKNLWGTKSEWYNSTSVLNGGRPVEFDGYMQVAVDTEVFYRAKNHVETFNDLTSDCKDGVNTC